MKKNILMAFVLLALPALAPADSQWVLEQCTLTYHVSHPLHQTEGVSHAARGKGACYAGQCDFLIAVPVKSFDSGDSNRDLHMLQVTRGAEFPMVVVRTRLPESAATSATINADLEVQFAGQTAQYKQVSFKLETHGGETHITGTIPATLYDFKIDPPSLLTMPVKNEIPVRVDMTWHPQ
ncbi:MAG TPA: YceI family protein [Terriglobales bacterium]|nr:YceI family protein [Terriglobales bacterium]